MQNLRKKSSVHFVSNVKAAERQLSKHTCCGWNEINDTFSVVQQRMVRIFWSKPTVCGFSVLELSKLLMYQFHYDRMLPMYSMVTLRPDGWPMFQSRLKLLFTDTDSFCYEVTTSDLYEDLQAIRHLLDTADYPKDHPRYDPSGAKVIGRFKDECVSVPPMHFVGLRPKLYSLLVKPGESQTKAKGVSSRYTKKHLRHRDYVTCLHEGVSTSATYNQIRSRLHNLATEQIKKVALSSFYDKRWVMKDTYDTLAHGHWSIEHEKHSALSVQSPYDCAQCASKYTRRVCIAPRRC